MSSTNVIWDIHHHWVCEEGYLDTLLRQMDRQGIEKVALIVMGPALRELFVRDESCSPPTHEDLAVAIRKHPDRFMGYGYIRPGHDTPDVIDRYADLGMAGLKFHMPKNPYGHEEYFPLYEKARENGMVCLFHTGIFYPPQPMPGEGIRSENCRPIHLEPIAHEFLDLPLIAAHLGVCWTEEAAALCRICPNIYADLSGRVDGWRSAMPIERFSQLLYWSEAHTKILFGSDVHADELPQTLEHQLSILRRMGWNEQQIQNVLRNNARRLFGDRKK